MTILPIILSVLIVAATVWLLIKKMNAQAILLAAGLFMLTSAYVLGMDLPAVKKPTGFVPFDFFAFIKESFSSTNAGVGLMIMAIGGFVAYSEKIGASQRLVQLVMRPLSVLKAYPNVTAICVLPIGHFLTLCIPSAAGLGLLMMAAIYPILTGLGVSRLSAVAVITGSTGLCVGPASVITASAITIMDIPMTDYFVNWQIPLVWPTLAVLMLLYFLVNRYYDRKESPVDKEETASEEPVPQQAPLLYAIIPLLPLILLVLFSDLFQLLPMQVQLDTTTAMLISLFVALCAEMIRTRSLRTVVNSLQVFWTGMAGMFKSVVTLIIAADIFAKGLISLGFITGLIDVSTHLGLEATGIGIVLTLMIFLAAMLMGSGNAAFFAFGPLVPGIASKLQAADVSLLLPMNLAASMGRSVSPVAGVVLATSEIAGVSPMQVVQRNLIPMGGALLFMLTYHYL